MAQLLAPVSTSHTATTPPERTYTFGFAVESDDQLAVSVNGIIVPPGQYRVVGATIVLDSTVSLVGGDAVVVYRDTDIARAVDFSDVATAAGPSVEVALARVYAILEELADALDRRVEGGRTRALIGVRTDVTDNQLILARADGSEERVDLPKPEAVGGEPFTTALRDAIAANTASRNRLSGAGLGQAYDALPDRNRFSNAEATKLREVGGWALSPTPPLPSPSEVLSRYQAAGGLVLTADERAQLAGLPAATGTLADQPWVDTRITDNVARLFSYTNDALIQRATTGRTRLAVRTQAFAANTPVDTSYTPVAGRLQGIQVRVDTRGQNTLMDRILINSSRLADLVAGDPLVFPMIKDGVRQGFSLLLDKSVGGTLTVAFDRASPPGTQDGFWLFEYRTPSVDNDAAIDARIALWARDGVSDFVPNTKLSPTFPPQWTPQVVSTSDVDAQANARIAAAVQRWALDLTTLIPLTKLPRLTNAKMPVNLAAARITSWRAVTSAMGAPAWLATFDGSYTSLTGRPPAYTLGQVVSDLISAPVGARLPFSALRDRTWGQIEGKPFDASWDLWDGSWANIPIADKPMPRTGDEVAVALSQPGAGRFPYRRISGGPPANALAPGGVREFARATVSDRVAQASLQTLLGIGGSLAVTMHTVADARTLNGVNTASGLHLAVVTTAFGSYQRGDVLAWNTSRRFWSTAFSLSSLSVDPANLGVVPTPMSVGVTSSSGTNTSIAGARPDTAGTSGYDPSQPGGAAGVMTAAQATRLEQAYGLRDVLALDPASASGLDPGAVRDGLAAELDGLRRDVDVIDYGRIVQTSIGAPSDTRKRPVRIATEGERETGLSEEAVLTVKQVHDTIPTLLLNGAPLPGVVRRINFRTPQ